MIHTTEVIKDFNFKSLQNKGILPSVPKFNQTQCIKHNPPKFVTKYKCYMFFGMFMEHAFRIIYECRTSDRFENIKVNVYTLFDSLKLHYVEAENCILTDEDYNQIYYILNEFCNTVEERDILPYNPIYNQELITPFGLMGLPDIISYKETNNEIIVYEMKNSTYFPNMEESTWLQILAYCSIYQELGYVVTTACVLLPMNNAYLYVNLNGFNFIEYYNLLQYTTINKINSMLLSEVSTLNEVSISSILGVELRFIEPKYGYHISKEKTIFKSIENVAYNLKYKNTQGLQLFIRNPKSGSGKISDRDKNQTNEFIRQHGVKIYCHDIYIVNLANPDTKFHISIEEIKDCVELGFSGLVVHCGKNVKTLKQSTENALNLMESRLRDLMNYATESCPVILETCAGQGTELCHELSDFLDFYRRFDNDLRLRICIDTCHVFAAGYCPLEFITTFLREEPNSISLIHLNGSEHCQGSRKDRHCNLHEGHINIDVINQIIDLCVEHSISMVRE